MATKILVPLKQNDRTEEIIPYIEKVAHPGMKVVFLVRYRVDFWWLRDHLQDMETGTNMHAFRQMAERYSWEGQERLAKQRVFPACEALHERGVEVAVEVHGGSLREVVRSYTYNRDVHLIMMRAGIGVRIKKFLQGTIAILGLFKRPSLSPMLLIHPRTLL